MTKVLTKLRITEVSSVDRGAGDGVKVLLMKRDAPRSRFNGVDFNKFRKRRPLSSPIPSTPGPVAANPDDRDTSSADSGTLHPKLEAYVSALMAANPALQREEALSYLLYTPAGAATARHLAEITKEVSIQREERRMENLRDVAKQAGGLAVIADHIIKKGATAFTEFDFAGAVMEAARLQKRDGESDAQAFSRVFESSPEVRRAYAICRGC